MNTTAVVVGTLMVSVGCATTGQVQPAATAAAVPTAQTAAPVVASEAQGAEGVGNLRCEYRPVIGSRVGQKICHSEQEWADLERQAKQHVKDIDARIKGGSYTDPTGGG